MSHVPASEIVLLPTAPTIWHCDIQAVHCRSDHLLAFYKSGYRADLRVSGHSFLQCTTCKPHEFFFALWSTEPWPGMVICYLLSKDSYDEWPRSIRTPPTPELLYRLRDPEGRSYNPSWRPQR